MNGRKAAIVGATGLCFWPFQSDCPPSFFQWGGSILQGSLLSSRKRSGGELTDLNPKPPGSEPQPVGAGRGAGRGTGRGLGRGMGRGRSAGGRANKAARLDFNSPAAFKGPTRAVGRPKVQTTPPPSHPPPYYIPYFPIFL